MSDAAVIVCPGDASASSRLAVRLGGLTLLARAALTARYAGISRLIVVGDEDQRGLFEACCRAEGNLEGAVWLLAGELPDPVPGRSLLLLPEVVVTAEGLRDWGDCLPETPGAVAPDTGGLGPLAVSSAHLAEAIAAARGGRRGLADFLADLQARGVLATAPWRGALREPVASSGDVPGVERRMLRALRTAEDGPIVDRYVNRSASGWLSRRLSRTSITPNQVTVASLLTGLLAAWLLGSTGYLVSLLGLCLFQASMVLDHADGEIARMKFQFSPLGKWLDNWSDHAVDVAAIGGLAWRAAQDGSTAHPILLGLTAAAGVTGSFLIVFWWSLHAERGAGRLPAAVAAMANRDGFCLALWAAVLLARPLWFLWALALGANLYWMIWLLRVGVPRRGIFP